MAPKTDRAIHQCPHCPAEYTTPVNLRAHQLAKHGLPNEGLGATTTEELMAELVDRMGHWSSKLWAVRAFMRGAFEAMHKAAETEPEVAEALNAVRR